MALGGKKRMAPLQLIGEQLVVLFIGSGRGGAAHRDGSQMFTRLVSQR